MTSSLYRVAVAITCHNRLEITSRCLASLDRVRGRLTIPHCNIRGFICDDGSTDGTARAIEQYSWCTLIKGDGNLYWTHGTMRAIKAALPWRPHWILLLNDDVRINEDALDCAIALSKSSGFSTVVGQTVDVSGNVSYGGYYRERHPLSFRLKRMPIVHAPSSADTFNGNFVLIPTFVYLAVGGLDLNFTHRIADVDLGLRLKRLNFPILTIPGSIGVCNRNLPIAQSITWKAKSLPHGCQLAWGIKAWPPFELLRYHVRHMGACGVITWLTTQLRPLSAIISVCRKLACEKHGRIIKKND